MKLIYLLFLVMIVSISLRGQEVSLVTFLNDEIHETSGLIILEGKVITHNDSGGEAALYEIDTISGEVSRKINLINATNVDWEDICHDDTYIYVGDFGNNAGERTNLVVYKILIDDYINAPDNGNVVAEMIHFNYEDQTDFPPLDQANNFDAEALIAYDDSLYIFTKNWGNFWTNIYALPKMPGDYQIEKIDSINVEGLVTGATYDEEINEISLIGYNFSTPFFVNIKEFSPNAFSSGTINRATIAVPDGFSIKIEGITKLTEDEYYLSAEGFANFSPALYNLNVDGLIGFSPLNVPEGSVYPNPANHQIYIDYENFSRLVIYDFQGIIQQVSSAKQVDITHLPKGIYFLLIENKKGERLGGEVLVIK